MKVLSIKHRTSDKPTVVVDCFVDQGYLQGPGGSLPDVDTDFQSDRRQDVKEYIERRYNHHGKQRVFSAGTLTTLKVKAVLKDVGRTMRIKPALVNYLTAIFDDDKCDFTGVFKLAAQNKKIAKFIADYPMLFEDIRTLMFQPRSGSIHASALLVTPDELDGRDVECFDFVPIKKVDNLLVSENDGYELDELGLLKNDCLATKELSKLQATMRICNEEYNTQLSLESLVMGSMNDAKVYALLSQGHTQNVFQFASRGMTKFLTNMKPTNINDLIAANALYRPATLENGSTEAYVDCKSGLVAPTYLWGTYEALKDTYGLITYQEQVVRITQEVGGLSLGDGVKLVKYISKKKMDKIHEMKDSFMKGALGKGCPIEDAEAIWKQIEACGSYLFNKCISGKETIYRPHGGKWKPTIGEMYKIYHDSVYARSTGHRALHDKYHRKGYGMSFSLTQDNRLVRNQIKDIRYMGVRQLYRITLNNGATIDVTDNHKHPTQRGEVRTDQLIVGTDCMLVNIGHIAQDTVCRFTTKGKGNDPIYHNKATVEYQLNVEKGRMGFQALDHSEYAKLKYYQQYYMPHFCEICHKEDVRLEIHHIDGDHSRCGHAYDNLITLCPSCHKKEHYKMGRTKMGERGLYTQWQIVVSIEYIGDDEVYDVEMDDPNHTFTTSNGVVTCNSHATAYAATSYVGAYLKANYPTAFYTIALQWADDDELVSLMGEMEACSKAKVVPPDINVSEDSFHTDYETDSIFWSLSRIKQLGTKAVRWIMDERNKNGDFQSITHFIDRIFKYKLKKYEYWDDPDNADEAQRCPVNARCVLNLILAGCFDKIERAESVVERFAIIEKAAEQLGFEIKESDLPTDMRGKHYFWSQQQVKVSGIGSVDYKRIYDNSTSKEALKGRVSYATLQEITPQEAEERRVAICATVVDVEERSFTSKKTGNTELFCKMTVQQNNDLCECVLWPEEYATHRGSLLEAKDKLVVFSAFVKYSDYAGKNNLQFYKRSVLEIL